MQVPSTVRGYHRWRIALERGESSAGNVSTGSAPWAVLKDGSTTSTTAKATAAQGEGS